MINLDDKKSNETHWISLLIDRNTAVSLILLEWIIFL